MSRGLTSTIQAELAKDQILFGDIIEIHFDSGIQRLTNAPFSLATTTTTGGSGSFAANGEFLSFDLVSETIDARVNQINIVLTAASSTFTNLFLNADSGAGYMNRRVVIYRLFYDAGFNQIDNPVMLWDGEVVGYKISETTKSSTISVTSSSVFYDFENIAGRRTNDPSQQAVFPGDRGMEFSTSAIADIKWGRPD